MFGLYNWTASAAEFMGFSVVIDEFCKPGFAEVRDANDNVLVKVELPAETTGEPHG